MRVPVYLPIMLDCTAQRCVVIGGGTVAERKILGLLEAAAEVIVISPDLTPRLSELAEKQGTAALAGRGETAELMEQDERAEIVGQDERAEVVGQDERAEVVGQDEITEVVDQDERAEVVGQDERAEVVGQDEITEVVGQDEITEVVDQDERAEVVRQGGLTWLARCYASGDLRGAFLVYAASNDRDVNEAVAREARSLGIPVNVVSHAETGSFISPGVLRRGRLTVAVSTSGAGPVAAGQIKGLLEEVLGAEYEPYLEFLHTMRTEIKKREATSEVRGRLLRKLGMLDVLNEIRQGTFIEWTPELIDGWIAANREE